MVPLLWPDIPPLVDLPGHMGRYRVQLDLHTYPWLTDWYDFHWQLIGNLGIDILVQIFAPMFGLELTVKLIVMAIPALIVVGLLWIAREVHGRIPADRVVRAAARLLLSAAVRVRQFHAVDGAGAAVVRAVAAAGAARQDPAACDHVRAILVRLVGLPHVRLGRAGRARFLRRDGPRA